MTLGAKKYISYAEIKESDLIQTKQSNHQIKPEMPTALESKPGIFQELKDGYNLIVKDIGILPLATSLCKELANRAFLYRRF